MKSKLISVLGLLLTATSLMAGAFEHQGFINGQALVVSNNTSIIYETTQSNVFYIDFNNLGRWAFRNTNFVASVGQNGTNYIPAAYYYTNAAAYSSTNGLIGGIVTNLNVICPPAIIDTRGWTDANGNAPTAATISATVNGVGSNTYDATANSPTNTVTLIFTKSADGLNFSSAGGVVNADSIVMAFAATALTNNVVMTNLPVTFMQGARKIRLAKLTTSNVSNGTNIVLGDISINGFIP